MNNKFKKKFLKLKDLYLNNYNNGYPIFFKREF